MLAFALQAVAAFNLVCTGTQTTGTLGNCGFGICNLQSRPSQVTFRVDLERQRWCTGDCQSTSPIASITDTMIVFRDNNRQPPTELYTSVNRESGQMINSEITGNFVSGDTGTCERVPFTGFPQRRF